MIKTLTNNFCYNLTLNLDFESLDSLTRELQSYGVLCFNSMIKEGRLNLYSRTAPSVTLTSVANLAYIMPDLA